MRALSPLSAALCLACLVGDVGCRKDTNAKEAANPAQDTMLMRDLAEANKNTAAAAAMVPRPLPTGSQVLTSGPRLKPPLRANDASGPTTVPTNLSPASGDPCDSRAPVDQRSCLNRSIVANDADLNRTYQNLLAQARKSGGSDLEDRFRQSQREWINQRDANCRAQTQTEDGKLWARTRARCLANFSTKRTAELQRNLSSLRGQ